MNTKPIVSIGLIPYNGEATIAEAIESLLAQTYRDFEIIISDDASTDRTVTICKKYAALDHRIRVIVQNKNLGLAGNSNFVLSQATGEYFMWAADDDLWDKTYLETLIKLHKEHPDTILAVSNLRVFKEGDARHCDSHLTFPSYSHGLPLRIHLLSEHALLVWGVFNIQKLQHSGGFHEDGRPYFGGSDFVTIWKVFLQEGGLAVSKKYLFYKRDTGSTLERFDVLKSLQFSGTVWQKIARYLTYPAMFCLDASLIQWATIRSTLTLREKSILWFYINRWLLRVMLDFFSLVARGVWMVLVGVYTVCFKKIALLLRMKEIETLRK